MAQRYECQGRWKTLAPLGDFALPGRCKGACLGGYDQGTSLVPRHPTYGTSDVVKNARRGSYTYVTLMPTVHVVLPVRNRSALTRQFLHCLQSQTYPHLRLLVIDDGSTDETAHVIRTEYPSAKVICGDGSLWWAGSLQKAYEWLCASAPEAEDVILIVNDDTSFSPDFVANAIDILTRRSRCLLLSRTIDAETGLTSETGIEADFARFRFDIARDPARINCLSTRGLFMRWGDMQEIGGFRPTILPHYWSDYEYTIRASRRGFACLTDDSVVLRTNAKATGERDLDGLVGWKLVHTMFSRRSPSNPVYSTAFVLIAAPWRWKAVDLSYVWARSLGRLLWQGALRRQLRNGRQCATTQGIPGSDKTTVRRRSKTHD